MRITKPDYDKKLQELMDRIQTLAIEMEEHSRADHDYKTTVATVLSVACRSKQIFEGAELEEKRQFINFLVQNPQMKDRELVFELKRPMNTVLELAHYSRQQNKTIGISTDGPTWLPRLPVYRTVEHLSDGEGKYGEVGGTMEICDDVSSGLATSFLR